MVIKIKYGDYFIDIDLVFFEIWKLIFILWRVGLKEMNLIVKVVVINKFLFVGKSLGLDDKDDMKEVEGVLVKEFWKIEEENVVVRVKW